MSGFGGVSSGGGRSGSVSGWAAPLDDKSPLDRAQQQYWTAKQSLLRRLGRKEDECVVASDSQLDAKLELYRSIGDTCRSLHRILGFYQEQLCVLAQEEYSLGRFLKEQGKDDKTRAGKMMIAVGKTVSYTAQQRLLLRTPLARLNQEVETFHERAVRDTAATLRRMEKARNEYRGALLWMKDISQQLDPDTGRHLDRFRKVQGEVKQNKLRFDKLKLDCLQKVDLLAASRCNMFSHSLVLYQSALLQFWQKTARTMKHVADCFTGYQYYEFSVVKELCEPSRRLADETAAGASSNVDPGQAGSSSSMIAQTAGADNSDDLLLPENELTASELVVAAQKSAGNNSNNKDSDVSVESDDVTLLELNSTSEDQLKLGTGMFSAEPTLWSSEETGRMVWPSVSSAGIGPDLHSSQPAGTASLEGGDSAASSVKASMDSLKANSGVSDLLAFDNVTDEESTRMLERLLASPERNKSDKTSATQHPTASALGGMQDLFGGLDLNEESLISDDAGNATLKTSAFLPSQLLTSGAMLTTISNGNNVTNSSSSVSHAPLMSMSAASALLPDRAGFDVATGATSISAGVNTTAARDKASEMSAWFGVFADLDPLANPDAVGGNQQRDQQRNC